MFNEEALPPNYYYQKLNDKKYLQKLEQVTLFNGKVYSNLLKIKKSITEEGLFIELHDEKLLIPLAQISIISFI